MHPVSVIEPSVCWTPPPKNAAELPVMVQSMSVGVPPCEKTPPPENETALLPVMLVPWTVSLPWRFDQ